MAIGSGEVKVMVSPRKHDATADTATKIQTPTPHAAGSRRPQRHTRSPRREICPLRRRRPRRGDSTIPVRLSTTHRSIPAGRDDATGSRAASAKRRRHRTTTRWPCIAGCRVRASAIPLRPTSRVSSRPARANRAYNIVPADSMAARDRCAPVRYP